MSSNYQRDPNLSPCVECDEDKYFSKNDKCKTCIHRHKEIVADHVPPKPYEPPPPLSRYPFEPRLRRLYEPMPDFSGEFLRREPLPINWYDIRIG